MTLHRYLDRFDQQQLDKQTAVLVRYAGQLNQTLMAHAYDLLTRAHPVLAGRVRPAADGYVLEVPDDTRVHFEFHRDAGYDYLHEIVQEWDFQEKVAQLTVLQATNGGLVAMHTDHCIADGDAKLALLRQLLQFHSTLAAGGRPQVELSRTLPAGAEEVLGRVAPGTSAGTGTSAYESFPFRQHYLHLSERQTHALLAAARSLRTSLHALICGAVLVAQRGYLRPGQNTMVCRTPVNLRSRIGNGIESTAVTNLSGLHLAEVEVTPDADPSDVGRRIKQQLDAGIADGAPIRDILGRYPGKPEAYDDATLQVANVSNLGAIPPFPAPPGIVITDFQILTQKSGYKHPGWVAYTYGGRLTVQIVAHAGIYSAADVSALADAFSAQLHRLSAGVQMTGEATR
ncbi:phthiocerol/phthiodiolone dimycocerosyl transferase family protein [Amycolatopsis sacchari]|uniref:phthiocerol/phthiodiolone dimycocerosyl transferase family protein n=1 Tax=Amycolatopsis sacchari TaxID=115433 RepID=UPI003EBDE134